MNTNLNENDNGRNDNGGNESEERPSSGDAASGLDNRRGVGRDPLRTLVGIGAQGERTYRAITEASQTYRRNTRPLRSYKSESWNPQRFADELERASRRHGAWITDIGIFADRWIFRGYESDIFLSKDGRYVIKLNCLGLLYGKYGIERFIDRLYAHNRVFKHTPYTIVGVTDDACVPPERENGELTAQGRIRLVLEQPYVDNAREATQRQIDNELRAMGFEETTIYDGNRGWTDGEYVLWDARPANVLIDEHGELCFIDIVINSC
jgi:hypothetical protein